MRAITAAAILTIAALLGLMPAMAAEAPQTRLEAITAPQPTLSTPDTTSTTKPPRRALEASEGLSCPGWIDVARDVGWPEAELPMVGAVTYLESRCQQGVRGDKGKSWTAFQIHTTSWCRPNRYWPDGWLQAKGIVSKCQDLLDPETAARAALAIWQYGGWRQWTTAEKASTTLLP
jgi:hypothetical protein